MEPDSFDSAIRLPSDQPVQPDGTIELGRFGRLSVRGKSIAEIETEVRQHIQSQLFADILRNPTIDADDGDSAQKPGSVSVRLVSRDSKVYYVVGEVNSPGTFPLIGRETIPGRNLGGRRPDRWCESTQLDFRSSYAPRRLSRRVTRVLP